MGLKIANSTQCNFLSLESLRFLFLFLLDEINEYYSPVFPVVDTVGFKSSSVKMKPFS